MENPSPGSDAALKIGCICDQKGNKYGKGFVLGDKPPIFFKEPLCPLHGPDNESRKEEENGKP